VNFIADNRDINMDDCEGDGLQQHSVEMERQISQVDNSIEEEMVMPVQVATRDMGSSSHHDDSGCTSDGDHTQDEEDDDEVSHASKEKNVCITRQNTYTVKSAVTETDSKNEQDTEVETSLLQRQNTYTVSKVMSETQQSSSQLETQSIVTQMVQKTELSQTQVTEIVQKSELSKSQGTEMVQNSELSKSNVTEIVDKSGLTQTLSNFTETMDKSELSQTQSQVTESVEKSELTQEIQSQFTESLHTVEYKYDGEEPVYKEPFTGDDDSENEKEEVNNKKESEYVTAEQVRNQKKKIQEEQGTVIVGVEDMTREPTIMEETSLLSSVAMSKKQSKSEEALSRTSQEVEQIIDQIRDPNFDCSLDDITAIIDGKTEDDHSPSNQNRGSPEFTTAVTMIEKNPDKGFDPEDPKVKNLEDWECSNLTASMESVEAKKSKFKNVLKRFSRHEETHSLLSDTNLEHSNDTTKTRDYYYGDTTDDDKVSPGCVGTSLLYIFLKIFD